MLPRSATADDSTEATVISDAHFGEVLFYFYQEDYFPAIVRLLAAQKQSQLENHGDESELLLGGMYLSYGHHLRAAEIFERLLADGVEQEIRNRTWFFLAKIWHQRGYLAESQLALDKIDTELPEPLEAERHMLQAQLLIMTGLSMRLPFLRHLGSVVLIAPVSGVLFEEIPLRGSFEAFGRSWQRATPTALLTAGLLYLDRGLIRRARAPDWYFQICF
jgi:tetratricopeptide (TPR) repeat protein